MTNDAEACMRYLEYIRYLEDMKTAPPIEELNEYLDNYYKEQDRIAALNEQIKDEKRDY